MVSICYNIPTSLFCIAPVSVFTITDDIVSGASNTESIYLCRVDNPNTPTQDSTSDYSTPIPYQWKKARVVVPKINQT